jgi:hypothetical protein
MMYSTYIQIFIKIHNNYVIYNNNGKEVKILKRNIVHYIHNNSQLIKN